MALVDQFNKGMFLIVDDALSIVVERKYKTQGRQGGLIILTVRNIETGQNITRTVKAGTKFEQVIPEYKEMQYMYSDGSRVYFMDTETFESVDVDAGLIGEYVNFLKEDDRYVVMFYEGRAVSIRTNPTVELEVTESVDAVRGNTANNATKLVTTETGYKAAVPLFVNKGDVIIINTETGQYNGRK